MAKTIMHALKISEISAVDRPAQAHAKAAILKRADIRKDMYQVSRFADLLSSVSYLMRSAEYEADSEKDNSPVPTALRGWLKSGAQIFQSMATEELNELLATVSKREQNLTATFDADTKPLLKKIEELRKALAAGSAVNSNGDPDMDPEIAKALGLDANAKPADIAAAIAKMADTLKNTASELVIAKAGMTDEEKAHHDALASDTDKDAFRKMSRGERAVKMAKREELPESVRKALEENDALKKRLAALEDKDELAALAKRATEIGMPEADATIIQKAYRGDKGAVDKILDVVKALTAQVKAAGLFKELGDGRDSNGGKQAYDELLAKAEDLRKSDRSLTREQAFAKVYQDPANAEIVKRERLENRPAA